MHTRLLPLLPLALLTLSGSPVPAATSTPDAATRPGHCHGARSESVLDDAAAPGHCHGARTENVLSGSSDQEGHCHGANGGEVLRANL